MAKKKKSKPGRSLFHLFAAARCGFTLNTVLSMSLLPLDWADAKRSSGVLPAQHCPSPRWKCSSGPESHHEQLKKEAKPTKCYIFFDRLETICSESALPRTWMFLVSNSTHSSLYPAHSAGRGVSTRRKSPTVACTACSSRRK